jgi:hypothetical protein
MTPIPQIPTPAHTLADSMLSRHFGRETVNYFSSKDFQVVSTIKQYPTKAQQVLLLTAYRFCVRITHSSQQP